MLQLRPIYAASLPIPGIAFKPVIGLFEMTIAHEASHCRQRRWMNRAQDKDIRRFLIMRGGTYFELLARLPPLIGTHLGNASLSETFLCWRAPSKEDDTF